MDPHYNKTLLSFVLLSLITLFFFSPKLYGVSKYAGIKNAIVIDFYDKTGLFNGREVADRIRTEMRRQAGFNVLTKNQTLTKYKQLKISRRKMLLRSYRRAAGKRLDVDAFIIGIITKTQKRYKLTMKLERTRPQRVVHLSTFTFKKFIGPNASRIATSKFLRIPYKFAKPEPTPIPTPIFTPTPTPTPPEMEEVAEPEEPTEEPTEEPAEVTEEKIAPTEEEPEKEWKFKEEPAKKEVITWDVKGEAPKRDWLTLKLSPVLLKNKYSVDNPAGSARINLINIDTSFFPDIYFSGELWFLRFLGIDVMYNLGFLTLNVTPPGGTAFSVSTRFSQLATGLKYRLFFMKREKSPYIFLRIGYLLQKLSPGTQATPVLSSNKYSDIPLGIGFKLPFLFIEKTDFGLNFSFDYFVISRLTESTVNNGTQNSSKGYQLAVGPYWKFFKSLLASFEFVYNHHSASFTAPDPAQGTRTDAVDGATSGDTVYGLIFAVGINL